MDAVKSALLLLLVGAASATYPLEINCTETNLCDKLQSEIDESSSEVEKFLADYNCNGSRIYCDVVFAQFKYYMNENEETQAEKVETLTAQQEFDTESAERAKNLDRTNITDIQKRELDKITHVFRLNSKDSEERNNLITEMTSIYGNATVCNYTLHEDGMCSDYPRTNHSAWWLSDPQLVEVMATSTNYDELQYAWEAWRNATGVFMRPEYSEYVSLSNVGAKESGFPDAGAFWRSNYDTGDKDFDLEKVLEGLWLQVLPLYEELHTYVRGKMWEVYGKSLPLKSTMPAHILGNMWAQAWNNIYRLTRPSDAANVDVTDEMRKQKWNQTKMFEEAKEFFVSINMTGYLPNFFEDSMIVRPKNRTVECYADSEDFFNGRDFGMAICTKVTMEDFIVIHHELGHINYFMEYSHQPLKFRDGANSGFHEAIGDTMALSATTLDHLHKIGLYNYTKSEGELPGEDLNFLFNMALQKIAFLPFGYLIDQYQSLWLPSSV